MNEMISSMPGKLFVDVFSSTGSVGRNCFSSYVLVVDTDGSAED